MDLPMRSMPLGAGSGRKATVKTGVITGLLGTVKGQRQGIGTMPSLGTHGKTGFQETVSDIRGKLESAK